DALRPPVDPAMTPQTFARWYWPVAELRAFCEALGLPSAGRKAELRDRVAFALAHPGQAPPAPPRRRRRSGGVDWKTAALSEATVIDEGVSFGPNLRGWFKARLGPRFSCHGDFMDWMRASPGRTLADAEAAWRMLEARKDDPAFRREIAECNEHLQYLRDLRDANPHLSLDQARTCWTEKARRPAREGKVRYAPEDLRFLD
ncbi:MAG: DUF6434 domain-containing protein, partial [Pseudomonadota bacterium]